MDVWGSWESKIESLQGIAMSNWPRGYLFNFVQGVHGLWGWGGGVGGGLSKSHKIWDNVMWQKRRHAYSCCKTKEEYVWGALHEKQAIILVFNVDFWEMLASDSQAIFCHTATCMQAKCLQCSLLLWAHASATHCTIFGAFNGTNSHNFHVPKNSTRAFKGCSPDSRMWLVVWDLQGKHWFHSRCGKLHGASTTNHTPSCNPLLQPDASHIMPTIMCNTSKTWSKGVWL